MIPIEERFYRYFICLQWLHLKDLKMDTQKIEPKEKTVPPKASWYKINTVSEAERPLKNTSNLFYVCGFICAIGGISLVILSSELPGLSILTVIFSIVVGVSMVICAYQLRKYKSYVAAWILFALSSLWLVLAIINVKVISIIIGLIAISSSIQAISLVRQLDRLKSEENTKSVSGNQ